MYYSESDYTQMALDLGFNLPRSKSKGMVSCCKHQDKHPSMSIDLVNGLFNCFSCGYKGHLASEYKKEFGKYFNASEERSYLNNFRSVLDIAYHPRVEKKREFFSYKINKKYDCRILRDWLAYRGISEKVSKASQVFYGAVDIEYYDEIKEQKRTYTIHDRVIFPILNEKRKVCSLEMRFPLFGNEPENFKESVRKVLYPKQSTTNLLYEQYKLNKDKKLYVLEGLLDCLAFRSLTDLENSTSIFGASITKHQLEVLNTFQDVCYVFNDDEAGWKSVQQLRENYNWNFTTLKPLLNAVGEMAKYSQKFSNEDISKWLLTETAN